MERAKRTRAYTRNGFDWTERYRSITNAAIKLDCRSATIDGEVVVQDEHGISDFEALESAIRWHPQTLIFCAFDLLHLNGKDLREGPLLERRARLVAVCSWHKADKLDGPPLRPLMALSGHKNCVLPKLGLTFPPWPVPCM